MQSKHSFWHKARDCECLHIVLATEEDMPESVAHHSVKGPKLLLMPRTGLPVRFDPLIEIKQKLLF
eukprot:6187259-Pleurochrysis_carterae.AAC.2